MVFNIVKSDFKGAFQFVVYNIKPGHIIHSNFYSQKSSFCTSSEDSEIIIPTIVAPLTLDSSHSQSVVNRPLKSDSLTSNQDLKINNIKPIVPAPGYEPILDIPSHFVSVKQNAHGDDVSSVSKKSSSFSDHEKSDPSLEGAEFVEGINHLTHLTEISDQLSSSRGIFAHVSDLFGITNVFDPALSFIKSKSFAQSLEGWRNRPSTSATLFADIRSHLFNSFSTIVGVEPLCTETINEISVLLVNSVSIRGSNAGQALMGSNGLLGYFAIGVAHGAQHLIYQLPCEHQKMRLDFNNDNLMNSLPGNSMSITLDDGVCNTTLIPMVLPVYNTPSNFGVIDNVFTPYIKGDWKNRNSYWYKIHILPNLSHVKYQFKSDVNNASISFRDDKGQQTSSKSTEINSTSAINVEVFYSNPGLMDALYALFHIDTFGFTILEKDLILQHLYSYILAFIKNAITYSSANDIASIKFSITIERALMSQSQLHVQYKDQVDTGYFLPISTLMWMHYFKIVNILDWAKFIFIAAVMDPGINMEFRSLFPSTNIASKNNWLRYAQDVGFRSTKHFYPGYEPATDGAHVAFSWNEICQELYFRYLSRDSIPSIVPLITRGDFRLGKGPTSLVISVPYENSNFNQFTLPDGDKIMNIINLSSLFVDKSEGELIRSTPKWVRSTWRMDTTIQVGLFRRFVHGSPKRGFNSLHPQSPLPGLKSYHSSTMMRSKVVSDMYGFNDGLSDLERFDCISDKRYNNPTFKFSNAECRFMMMYPSQHEVAVENSSLNTFKEDSVTAYTPRLLMDKIVIDIWNDLYGRNFKINDITQLNDAANRYVEYYNSRFNGSAGATLRDNIKFANAFSKSSLIGIQKVATSQNARDSMSNAIKGHTQSKIRSREWMIDELNDVFAEIELNPHIMEHPYHKIVIGAKMSSSSTKGEKRNYRDYVFDNPLSNVMENLRTDGLKYSFYAGTRLDRRGKWRIICSCSALLRIIDSMLNSGSYNLFDHNKGLLRSNSTEGLNTSEMWHSMRSMTAREGYSSVCTDYSAYDAQFGPLDYFTMSYHLNKHRLKNPLVAEMFSYFTDFCHQPKNLVISGEKEEVIIKFYHTLASGLIGTHSFENLWGIATHRALIKAGIDIKSFWVNGDDQNALIKTEHIDDYFNLMNANSFDISVSKSISKNLLVIWSQQWFSDTMYPTGSLGAIRSLTETEGKGLQDVEASKIASNYGAILKVIMIMIRAGQPEHNVLYWIRRLCSIDGVNIDPFLIPISLNELLSDSSENFARNGTPKGLESEKYPLESITLPYHLVNARHFYDMLHKMWRNKTTVITTPKVVTYYPKGTTLNFKRLKDYSIHGQSLIPFSLRMVMRGTDESQSDYSCRQFLQSCNAYDGSVDNDYEFHDMISLARAIIQRNEFAWKRLS